MKPIKIKEKTLRYKKHNLLISAIQYNDVLLSGVYEIGVFDLDNDFEEKELVRVNELQDCEFYFNKFIKKYTEVKVKKEDTPIPKRYLKFAEDYNKVYNSCKDYIEQNLPIDDGSALNFDTCAVFIGKRVQKGFLNAALRPYKLKAHITNGLVYIVVPFTNYQGNGNTIQVEYMANAFKLLGYDSSVFYQID